MKELGRKNTCYSLLLAAVLMLLLLGYFIWMLPSLYVAYTEEQNLEAIRKQHQAFLETGTYDNVRVKNPTACMSVKIPLEENYISVASKIVSVKITAANAETEKLMDEIQSLVRQADLEKLKEKSVLSDKKAPKEDREEAPADLSVDQKTRELMEQMQDRLEEIFTGQVQLPVQVEITQENMADSLYSRESFQVHDVSDHGMILEASVFDDENQYTNYLAVEKVSDGFVFSVLPVITPQIGEIRPVVLQSVPMLCAVILMLVLIFSRLYSNGIVRPVYKKLQDINQELREENERQEMFLRASSHQLKTPITAALLLLDGMIGKVGKYRDREAYLPKVKEQLLYMRRMVDEILSLNRYKSKTNKCQIRLFELVQAQADAYRVAAADKQLEVCLEGDREALVLADGDILAKMIDNLLSNAVSYTPQGERIVVKISEHGVRIQNEGVTIPQNILQHIFEPFVRGEHETMSHGLGLYIAAYYAKMMQADLRIWNQGNSVVAVLELSVSDKDSGDDSLVCNP